MNDNKILKIHKKESIILKYASCKKNDETEVCKMSIILAIVGVAVIAAGITLFAFKKVRIPVMTSMICAGIAICVLGSTVTIIEPNHTGILVRLGVASDSTKNSGMYFKVPFIESIETVDNRYKKTSLNEKCWSETSERTPVYYDGVEVTYQIPAEASYWVFMNIPNYEAEIIDNSVIASALKASSVKLLDSESTNRGKIEPLALKTLQQLVDAKYGSDKVKIVSLIVSNADFEDAYNEALSEKNRAVVKAETIKVENQTRIEEEKANQEVARIKAETEYNTKMKAANAEADAAYVIAQKQAEANKLLNESLSEEILRSKFYETWNGELPQYVGGDKGSFIFNMIDDSSKDPVKTNDE